MARTDRDSSDVIDPVGSVMAALLVCPTRPATAPIRKTGQGRTDGRRDDQTIGCELMLLCYRRITGLSSGGVPESVFATANGCSASRLGPEGSRIVR